MIKTAACLLFCINIFGLALADGTVEYITFYSDALNSYRSVNIYLPEGYDPNGNIDYPAVYFLHGGGYDHNSYPFMYDILDTLIGQGTIDPFIVVKPDGNCYSSFPYDGGYYTNTELFGDFEDYIVIDLIAYIDSNYRTDPDNRGFMGHSIGGYGCMKLALKFPDSFIAVASHGGTPDLNTALSVYRPLVMAEAGGSPPYSYSPDNGIFTLLTFGWSGAFTPNLGNPPYYVDFPLNDQGDIIDTVVTRWAPHNPAHLAAGLPPGHGLSIYFDCGLYDQYECLPMNRAFAESLITSGVSYVYYEYPGDHFNRLPERFNEALLFFDWVISSPVGIEEEDISQPGKFVLSRNYPNPFNASTKIEYTLSRESQIEIAIYDIAGRRIEILLNTVQSAGSHSVTWDASDYSSGIYFYSIKAGERSESRKMTLVK